MHSKWNTAYASVIGRRHISESENCQDASLAGISPRPFAVVCDGLGSANLSEYGSKEAVVLTPQILLQYGHEVSSLLDEYTEGVDKKVTQLSQYFYSALVESQKNLSVLYGANYREFQYTYLLVVAGHKRIFYMQVGDGVIIKGKEGQASIVIEPLKGLYANETYSVSVNSKPRILQGIIDLSEVDAIAILSDGSEEKMVSNDRAVAKLIPRIWECLRQKKISTKRKKRHQKKIVKKMREFTNKDVERILNGDFWAESPAVIDDRSMAIMVMKNGSL